jgi:hypothetical protein
MRLTVHLRKIGDGKQSDARHRADGVNDVELMSAKTAQRSRITLRGVHDMGRWLQWRNLDPATT